MSWTSAWSDELRPVIQAFDAARQKGKAELETFFDSETSPASNTRDELETLAHYAARNVDLMAFQMVWKRLRENGWGLSMRDPGSGWFLYYEATARRSFAPNSPARLFMDGVFAQGEDLNLPIRMRDDQKDDKRLLNTAIEEQNGEWFEWLLAHGADPDGTGKEGHQYPDERPLVTAARLGRADMVSTLLAAGASATSVITRNGEPLHLPALSQAIQTGNWECVKRIAWVCNRAEDWTRTPELAALVDSTAPTRSPLASTDSARIWLSARASQVLQKAPHWERQAKEARERVARWEDTIEKREAQRETQAANEAHAKGKAEAHPEISAETPAPNALHPPTQDPFEARESMRSERLSEQEPAQKDKGAARGFARWLARWKGVWGSKAPLPSGAQARPSGGWGTPNGTNAESVQGRGEDHRSPSLARRRGNALSAVDPLARGGASEESLSLGALNKKHAQALTQALLLEWAHAIVRADPLQAKRKMQQLDLHVPQGLDVDGVSTALSLSPAMAAVALALAAFDAPGHGESHQAVESKNNLSSVGRPALAHQPQGLSRPARLATLLACAQTSGPTGDWFRQQLMDPIAACDGLGALHFAALFDCAPMVRGLTPVLQSSRGLIWGETPEPLILALMSGAKETAWALMEAGAKSEDVEHQSFGLLACAQTHHWLLFEALIERLKSDVEHAPSTDVQGIEAGLGHVAHWLQEQSQQEEASPSEPEKAQDWKQRLAQIERLQLAVELAKQTRLGSTERLSSSKQSAAAAQETAPEYSSRLALTGEESLEANAPSASVNLEGPFESTTKVKRGALRL